MRNEVSKHVNEICIIRVANRTGGSPAAITETVI